MAETQDMIASVVVVPEDVQQELIASTTGSGKRRQPSLSEAGNKRPRLSLNDDKSIGRPTTAEEATAVSPTTDLRADGTTRRRRDFKEDERARGKRLFGSIVGTLSQSSLSTGQKRRVEIEKKQQAKLQVQVDADNEKQRRQVENLRNARRVEQVKYDQQTTRLNNSNALATAHSLHTKTEPILYYRPWKLRPDEEAQIKRQVQEVEARISDEVGNAENSALRQEQQAQEEELGRDSAREQVNSEGSNGIGAGGALEEAQATVGSQAENPNLSEAVKEADTSSKANTTNIVHNLDTDNVKDMVEDSEEMLDQPDEKVKTNGHEDEDIVVNHDEQSKENENDEEETLVEAGEDQVEY